MFTTKGDESYYGAEVDLNELLDKNEVPDKKRITAWLSLLLKVKFYEIYLESEIGDVERFSD